MKATIWRYFDGLEWLLAQEITSQVHQKFVV